MSETNFTLTKEYLHQVFEYKDGHLYYKQITGQRSKIGQRVGFLAKTGYFSTSIKKRSFLIHRLIFLMFYGYLPKQVDHINSNRADNTIENLREADNTTNQWNVKIQKNNTSGYKNVNWVKKDKRYKVEITVNKTKKYLGYFADLELAVLVAHEARDLYHGKFARHN
jgi:hypothetical protein